MTDAFTAFQAAGVDQTDLSNLKDHLIQRATLYDGMGGQKKTSTMANVTEIAEAFDIDPQDAYDYLVHRTNRGPAPGCRIPDHIYKRLAPDAQRTWHGFDEDTKRVFVEAMETKSSATGSTQPTTDSRRAYSHTFEEQNSYDDASGDGTVDPELVQDIHHILVNATKAKRTPSVASSISSGTRPPSSKSSKSQKSPPTKSEIGPAHPSVLLSGGKIPVHDKKGNKMGYVNKKMIVNIHRWIDFEGNEYTPDTTQEDCTYSVSLRRVIKRDESSLCDRGANGVVAGADCVWIGGPVVPRTVNITGIDDHQIGGVPIGTVGTKAMSNRGPVILIYNKAAYHGRNQTILSAIQLEHYSNKVDGRSVLAGGGQRIVTPDGYILPLSIANGLPYLKTCRYTQEEYDTLPHVIMTSDKEWDPRVFDNDVDPKNTAFYAANPENLHLLPDDEYNVKGEYIGMKTVEETSNEEAFVEGEIFEDAKQEIPDSPTRAGNLDFWIDEAQYRRNEAVVRCIHTATRLNEQPLRGTTSVRIGDGQ
jgi:hypothetical protein